MKRILLMAAIMALALAGQALAKTSLVDDSGRTISFDAPFRRIISLYGAHTENLFSLGLDREIIGVSTSEVYPPPALKKPAFSYRDGPERFLAARPDLVLIRPMIYRGHRALVDNLERSGITVVSLQPRTPEELFAYWKKLGKLTGRKAGALAMAEKFKKGLAEIRQAAAHVPEGKRPRVYFEAIHRRMKTFAPDSMAVFALENAGGVNLAADASSVRGTNIASFGKERILSLGGRMDVYLAQTGPMNRVSRKDIMEESGFSALKAVRQGRVYLVDEKLVSRPTLRLLQGVCAIQKLLYPNLAGPRACLKDGLKNDPMGTFRPLK